MSQMVSAVRELAGVHHELEPLLAWLNEAPASAPGFEEREVIADGLINRERGLVEQIAAGKPQSDQDALAVGLVLLEQAVVNDAAAIGDGVESAAALALVRYLADRAGVEPGGLGIFRSRLAQAESLAGARAARAKQPVEPEPPRPTLRARLEALRAAVPAGNLMAVRAGQWVDFYGEDARHVSDALGIVINQRRDGEGGTIDLCGLPATVFEGRLPAIEAAGRRVSVVGVE